ARAAAGGDEALGGAECPESCRQGGGHAARPYRRPAYFVGGGRTPPDTPRARGLAPGPQVGGQCCAAAELLPRPIDGLEPWPSAVALARWLRPARFGVPPLLRRRASFPESDVRKWVAQPMLAHHPDRRSAAS